MPASSFIQLLGFGLLAYGVNLEAGTGWGVITGGLAVVFVGHYWDDGSFTKSARVAMFRFRNFVRALRQEQEADAAKSSPHPPLHIDAEKQEMAKRLAEARIRRGDGRYVGQN